MVDRISRHKGVIGVMFFNKSGIAIKSNLDHEQTQLWTVLVSDMVNKSRDFCKTFGESINMTQLRVHSTKHETMISLEKDHILVVIHRQVNENYVVQSDVNE